ncbi:MAG TPA: endonuclease/exonuclease/phosphatase family protein [Candidatus Limnocylindrales bacterium]|jgi:endonuclease/exonuclease/phosphatase family metal-dependent hydrolase
MRTLVRVLTLNILNMADRWPERLPLLLAEFAALQPDIAGLQEVVYVMHQDRLLGAAGPAQYAIRRAWSYRHDEAGNSILVRHPLADGLLPDDGHGRLDLGLSRSAGRAELALPDGLRVRIVNTHLHHMIGSEHDQVRAGQAEALLTWLAGLPPVDVTVMTGDFNADPAQPTVARVAAAGFRSAYREANGADPDVTWPSGLRAPAMDTDGPPACLDYVWVEGRVAVRSARLVFDRPAVEDATLFASDHRGVLAELELGD